METAAMRYCWTLVMAAGLLGMNAAGWMAYHGKPRPAPRGEPVRPEPAATEPEDPPRPKPPPPEVKPTPPVSPKPDPEPARPPDGYLKHMQAGEQSMKDRRWRDAVASFQAAAGEWAGGLEKAVARIADAHRAEAEEFDDLLAQARERMKRKELSAARSKANEALALGVRDAEARALIVEIDRLTKPPPPPPEKKLGGDVLVLVLRTQTSSISSADFRDGLKGLEDVLGKKGTLLGGKVWVLDATGAKPWDPAALYPQPAALDNRDFPKLTDAIKTATAKLEARAVKPKFRVVVVWETDNKIDRPIELPDRRYWLAYRYTLGDEDIAGLDRSFVFASRFRSPGTVQKEVTYVATRKAPGGTP